MSHKRGKPNTKKTPNGKRKRNAIEKFLSINCHAGKRTLVHKNLFDEHTNTKESGLRRLFRDSPNRITGQVEHSMLGKRHKGLAEKSVRNRSDGKGPKILKSKTTLFFRNEDNLNIKPGIGKATGLKNGVAKSAKSLTILIGDQFVISNIRAVQTRGTRGTSSGNNRLNLPIKAIPKESLRKDVGTNGSPTRKGVRLARVVQLSRISVSSVLKLGRTNSAIRDRTMRNFNRKGKGKSGSFNPFGSSPSPNGSILVLHTGQPGTNGSKA